MDPARYTLMPGLHMMGSLTPRSRCAARRHRRWGVPDRSLYGRRGSSLPLRSGCGVAASGAGSGFWLRAKANPPGDSKGPGGGSLRAGDARDPAGLADRQQPLPAPDRLASHAGPALAGRPCLSESGRVGLAVRMDVDPGARRLAPAARRLWICSLRQTRAAAVAGAFVFQPRGGRAHLAAPSANRAAREDVAPCARDIALPSGSGRIQPGPATAAGG